MGEIIPINQLSHRIEFLRSKNKDLVVVATNGCFDILHVGHIRFLQKAKSYGDILIVGLNSDFSVKKIKDKSRPINNENERAEILAALRSVDLVSIFNEENALNFLKEVNPDIYVKGDEYDLDNLQEAKQVKATGGKIILIPMIPGASSTNIIEKLKKLI